MQSADLFTRLSTVHRPDCALFEDGPVPKPAPDPEEVARMLGSSEAAAYADACRPVFEDLRRVIGQLAGLMILAQLTRSTEVADLSELSSCRARWESSGERLAALSAPAALTAHLEQISAAHVFCGRALGTFSLIRPSRDNDDLFDDIARHVRRAYVHLRAVTSEKAGLEMVDLTHACCSCGR
ncbi:hypothetical protein [Martelella sp. AMO21009]